MTNWRSEILPPERRPGSEKDRDSPRAIENEDMWPATPKVGDVLAAKKRDDLSWAGA